MRRLLKLYVRLLVAVLIMFTWWGSNSLAQAQSMSPIDCQDGAENFRYSENWYGWHAYEQYADDDVVWMEFRAQIAEFTGFEPTTRNYRTIADSAYVCIPEVSGYDYREHETAGTVTIPADSLATLESRIAELESAQENEVVSAEEQEPQGSGLLDFPEEDLEELAEQYAPRQATQENDGGFPWWIVFLILAVALAGMALYLYLQSETNDEGEDRDRRSLSAAITTVSDHYSDDRVKPLELRALIRDGRRMMHNHILPSGLASQMGVSSIWLPVDMVRHTHDNEEWDKVPEGDRWVVLPVGPPMDPVRVKNLNKKLDESEELRDYFTSSSKKKTKKEEGK